MNEKKHRAFWVLLLAASFVASLLWSSDLEAQCSMCRTALTNSAEGQRWARGINAGIMLLLLAPFLIVGLITLQIYSRPVNSALLKLHRRCQEIVSSLRRRARRPVASVAAQQSGHGGT